MKVEAISRDKFDGFITSLNIPSRFNNDYLYEVYEYSIQAINNLEQAQIVGELGTIDSREIILYLLGEYLYSTANLDDEKLKDFLTNEKIKESMAGVTADKYISLGILAHKEGKVANKYMPPISSLNIYANFMLQILNGYQKLDPKTTLITDLLNKSISIMRCILKLLIEGYETEALASWRTLHECECTLILLDKYSDLLINSYLKHMSYGIAYKNGIPNKEEQDKVFVQIKEEMKSFDLKSKDMKKYIEYGWLTSLDSVKNDETFKFNFRDGLEKVAGLEQYSDVYQLSSEILHSTPLLIYNNKKYFYFLTLLSTYESFFRLEKVFVNLFASKVGEKEMEHYKALRNVYYSQLVNIHKRESQLFKMIANKKEA